MSNEIKVGDWTLTEDAVSQLTDCSITAFVLHQRLGRIAKKSCEILGIDPTTDSIARDIAEEIVLHGTPVEEAIRNIQAYHQNQ